MHLRQLVLLRLHLLLGGKRLPYCVRSTADPIHPLRRQQFGQDHSHVPKAAAQVMISTLAPAPTAPAPAPPAPVRLAGVIRCMHHANTGTISFSSLMHRFPFIIRNHVAFSPRRRRRHLQMTLQGRLGGSRQAPRGGAYEWWGG